MLDRQGWTFLLINSIMIAAVMLMLFKFQENKIKILFKKIDKKKRLISETQSELNCTKDIIEEKNTPQSDIDSFIDPLE